MATNVLFITETFLKDRTALNKNTSSLLIKEGITLAQDVELQRILGSHLYNQLQTLIRSTDIELNENMKYKCLLEDYVIPSLIYWSYYYTLEAVYLRPRNNGLVKPMGGETSKEVEDSSYHMMRTSAKQKAENYSERLRKYLIEEESSFPELTDSRKLYQDEPDYGSQYGSPFVFAKDIRTERLKEKGIRVYDSRYKQYPQ